MTDSFDLEVGARVQALREARGLMQAELASNMKARGLNWSQTILSKVERGERPLRLQEATALVKELSLASTDDLAGSGPFFAGRIAEVSWSEKSRKDELTESAFAYLQSVANQSILRLCQALSMDSAAAWKVNQPLYELPAILREVYFQIWDSGSTEPNSKTVQLLGGLGVPAEAIEGYERRIEALVEAVMSKSDASQVWGDYAFLLQRDNVDEELAEHAADGDDYIVRPLALQVAFSELFSQHFPNVIFETPVVLRPGTAAAAAHEIYISEVGDVFRRRLHFAAEIRSAETSSSGS